jgi:hypothetical protein
MNSRVLAFGVLSILAATSLQASATTIYNSYSGASTGYDDGPGDGAYTVAQEFNAGSAPFDTVQLALTAANTSDNGSVALYLVPNSNVNFGSSAGASFNFSGLTAIATIYDSALTTTGATGPTASQLTTLTIAASSIPAASDGELWLVVASATSGCTVSSFGWWSGTNGGVGTSGQLSANDGNNLWGTFDTTAVGGDQYGLIVSDVPEPATIAILGFGLAGLRYFRRRMSV